MKTHRLLTLALACTCSLALQLSPSWILAEDKEDIVPDGPWISSIAWQDADTLLGTHSQGLLFRAGQVVSAPSANPQTLTVIGESETSLWSVCPVSDGRSVATTYKGAALLFDSPANQAGEAPSTGKSFELDARWIRALEPVKSSGELLAGTEDGKLLVLSVDETKELRRIDAHSAAIFDIAFSAAGDKVATAAGDGTLKVFSWPQLEPLASMSVGSEAIWSCLFIDNDTHLVSGGASRSVQLWDVAAAQSIISLASAHDWITSLAALPDTNLVVAGCMDGNLLVVDTHTMHSVTEQPGPGSAIWSVALSPDNLQLAVGTRKHGMAVLEVQPWIEAGANAAQELQGIRPPAPKK